MTATSATMGPAATMQVDDQQGPRIYREGYLDGFDEGWARCCEYLARHDLPVGRPPLTGTGACEPSAAPSERQEPSAHIGTVQSTTTVYQHTTTQVDPRLEPPVTDFGFAPEATAPAPALPTRRRRHRASPTAIPREGWVVHYQVKGGPVNEIVLPTRERLEEFLRSMRPFQSGGLLTSIEVLPHVEGGR